MQIVGHVLGERNISLDEGVAQLYYAERERERERDKNAVVCWTYVCLDYSIVFHGRL